MPQPRYDFSLTLFFVSGVNFRYNVDVWTIIHINLLPSVPLSVRLFFSSLISIHRGIIEWKRTLSCYSLSRGEREKTKKSSSISTTKFNLMKHKKARGKRNIIFIYWTKSKPFYIWSFSTSIYIHTYICLHNFHYMDARSMMK